MARICFFAIVAFHLLLPAKATISTVLQNVCGSYLEGIVPNDCTDVATSLWHPASGTNLGTCPGATSSQIPDASEEKPATMAELKQVLDGIQARVTELRDSTAAALEEPCSAATAASCVKSAGSCSPQGSADGDGSDLVCLPAQPPSGACNAGTCGANKIAVNMMSSTAMTTSSETAASVDICATQSLDAQMKDVQSRVNATSVFVSTTSGVLREFPGVARNAEECGADPRLDDWYNTAATGPKDIVLILDTSGSMKWGTPKRWDLLLPGLRTLLETLTPADNVAIVTFSDRAQVLGNRDTLQPATTELIAQLENELNLVSPRGSTNFLAGLQTAFDLIDVSMRQEVVSGCNSAVLFFTDGRDDGLVSGSPCQGSSNVKSCLVEQSVQINKHKIPLFTYSISNDADDSVPRMFACANYGTWGFINKEEDVLSRMKGYYRTLSFGTSGTNRWAWTVHNDVIKVSMPVHNLASGQLLGVVGLQLGGFATLTSPQISQSQVEQELRVRSKSGCRQSELNQCGADQYGSQDTCCKLQYLRAVGSEHDYYTGSECPFPADMVSSSNFKKIHTQCVSKNRHAYLRIDRRATWEDAQASCSSYQANGRSLNGKLAQIQDDAENSLISSIAVASGSWIGFRANPRTQSRRPFSDQSKSEPHPELFNGEWTDGSTDDFGANYPWGLGEPNNWKSDDGSGEECTFVDRRGVRNNWNDQNCNDKITYICEFETTCEAIEGLAAAIDDEIERYGDLISGAVQHQVRAFTILIAVALSIYRLM